MYFVIIEIWFASQHERAAKLLAQCLIVSCVLHPRILSIETAALRPGFQLVDVHWDVLSFLQIPLRLDHINIFCQLSLVFLLKIAAIAVLLRCYECLPLYRAQILVFRIEFGLVIVQSRRRTVTGAFARLPVRERGVFVWLSCIVFVPSGVAFDGYVAVSRVRNRHHSLLLDSWSMNVINAIHLIWFVWRYVQLLILWTCTFT